MQKKKKKKEGGELGGYAEYEAGHDGVDEKKKRGRKRGIFIEGR